VRDYGLLEAALARPRATAFGKDAYPDLDAKAAALLHSTARDHALTDGSKRLALAAVIAFSGLNGRRLTLTNDEACNLVMSVAAVELDTVDAIAAVLQHATQPRRQGGSARPPGPTQRRSSHPSPCRLLVVNTLTGAQGDHSQISSVRHRASKGAGLTG
jgi:death on curing protein